jgi:hypothetical protein
MLPGISIVEIPLSDFKIIKDETLNILLAGRDTVSLQLPFESSWSVMKDDY